jgi:hypothetical protein
MTAHVLCRYLPEDFPAGDLGGAAAAISSTNSTAFREIAHWDSDAICFLNPTNSLISRVFLNTTELMTTGLKCSEYLFDKNLGSDTFNVGSSRW